MRILAKLLQLLEKPQKKMFVLFALLSLLSPLSDVFVVSRFIPVVQRAFRLGASEETTCQVVALAFALLLVGVLNLLKDRYSAAMTMDIAHDWSLKIYKMFLEEELEDHQKKNAVQAVNNVRKDPEICAGMITSYVNVFVDALTGLAFSAMMVYTSGLVGVFTFFLIAVFILAFYLFGRTYIIRCGEEKRWLEIKTGSLVSTAFGAYKEAKVDSRKKKLLEKYQEASANYARTQKKYMLIQGLQGVLIQNFTQTALLLLLAVVLAMGVDLSRVLSGVVIYITLLTRLLTVSYRIAYHMTSLQYASKYYEGLRAAMDQYSALRKKQAGQVSLREKQVTLKRGIRVENLSFHYPNGKQIFENASIDIPAGHTLAIVGPSGEGKTTFLDLVLGLLHPQSGHIWYDDFDIVEERDGQGPCRADIGSIVSYIPQTVYLNGDTVRNNVAFMVDEDEERLVECLKNAQVWEDIQEMADGLDTIIGENGVAISGGQRQRIALARALYKQFEILIMDEATAALDIDTECAVIDSVRKAREGKTLLLVTHHLHLANECEYVYRLENRKLVRVR